MDKTQRRVAARAQAQQYVLHELEEIIGPIHGTNTKGRPITRWPYSILNRMKKPSWGYEDRFVLVCFFYGNGGPPALERITRYATLHDPVTGIPKITGRSHWDHWVDICDRIQSDLRFRDLLSGDKRFFDSKGYSFWNVDTQRSEKISDTPLTPVYAKAVIKDPFYSQRRHS